jgi:hypothetical protein
LKFFSSKFTSAAIPLFESFLRRLAGELGMTVVAGRLPDLLALRAG